MYCSDCDCSSEEPLEKLLESGWIRVVCTDPSKPDLLICPDCKETQLPPEFDF